jgi:hypothetical protein
MGANLASSPIQAAGRAGENAPLVRGPEERSVVSQGNSHNDGKNNPRKEPERAEDGGDHAADSARVGGGASGGIHRPCVDLLQVSVAHDPGDDSQRNTAREQTQDAEDQDESASMWFHYWWLTLPASINEALRGGNL